MLLDPRAVARDRRGIDVGDDLHRVRVAHRHQRHLDLAPALELERPEREAASVLREAAQVLSNGRLAGSKSGGPMSTVTRPSSPRRSSSRRFMVSTASVRLVGEALVAHDSDEAARAVAALLDLVAAAAVEDAIAEVDLGVRRLLDDQDLVGADAEATVGEAPASARRRASSGARVASRTTKSLPAPCILVKRTRMRGLSAPARVGVSTATARPAGGS